MNRVHTAFFAAGDGAKLKAILEKPIHQYGYVLFSRHGLAAIGAAAWEIDPVLEKIPPERRTRAVQACGALIGDLIEAMGAQRKVSGDRLPVRKRVRGSTVIRSGSVWEFSSDRPLVMAAERVADVASAR